MDFTDTPPKISVPFADLGAKNTIPVPSQIAITPGAASYTDGFPPLTRTPLAAGGIPPFGVDMNGILNSITDIQRWQSAGGLFPYDAALSTAIGGYPKGARLINATATGVWINTVDNNTTNPDSGGAGWVSDTAYGVLALAGLTNTNVTLTTAQAINNRITLAGTLTGNIQIIFPTWTKDWTLVNNTSGAFSITAKTAAGGGVVIPQGSAPTLVTGDGTNITQVGPNIAPAVSITQAVQVTQLHSAPLVRGLVAQNNTGTPNTRFDASADLVILRNPTVGTMSTALNVATITNDISVAGPAANGRDQAGAFPASNYVHFYFIWNGTTLATLSSLAAPTTGPTLPSGYTHWAYIGVVILTAGSAITPVRIRGSRVTYDGLQNAVVGGSATVQTAISVATLIPPNALSFTLSIRELAGSADGTGKLDVILNLGVASGVTHDTKHFGIAGVTAGTSQFSAPGCVELPNVGRNYYYSMTQSFGTGPATTHSVTGYKIPNGGE